MAEPNPIVSVELEGDIGVVLIDNPPVNALAQPVRQELLAAIERLDGDASIHALVLCGAGRNFIAGADVREFDAAPLAPLLNDVLLRLEACSKPVVAALHGAALGGGAEVALASHYRCASGDLQLGFPEVNLGLLPGAGGTVRLPRLIGARVALEMITSGKPLTLERALALKLIDRAIEGPVRSGAIAYARELLAAAAPCRRTRELPIVDAAAIGPDFFSGAEASMPAAVRKQPSVARIVRCVEAAVSQSFEAALALARQQFEACRVSRESGALRRLFLAERRSAAAHAPARPVARIGVLGAGTMGSGISLALAQAGMAVTLVDTSAAALERGLERLRSTLDESVKKQRMEASAAATARALVTGATDFAALADVDLVIEAVFEQMQVKQSVFAQLGRTCRPGTVLATNTSTLDVDEIAAASGRAADVLGMHFFSPAHLMRLVEIVRARSTSAEALGTAASVTKRLGKIGVVVGNCFGFVGNRMLYAYGREKELLLLEGVPPERIDSALEAFGMAMGPNAVGDMAGIDIGVNARRAWRERPDDPLYYRVSELLVEQGRLGQKSGRGFYRYDNPQRRRQPDPAVDELIRAEARRLGVAARAVTDDEISSRCVLALVNEAARILAEGIVPQAIDIDVIWCNGYGFPRTLGGPLYYADQLGLAQVLCRIEQFATLPGGGHWQPAPLLLRVARSGGCISEWHGTVS